MIRKIILIVLPVLALIGGAFAGDMLRTPATQADADAPPAAGAGDHDAPATEGDHPTETAEDHGTAAEGDHATETESEHDAEAGNEAAWFQFPTQFFIPLMRQGDLRDVMILTLTLQTDAANLDAMSKKEHTMRDALLRQLMIHANTGGFDGNFTADRNLATLREGLLQAATSATDLPLTAVLIEDIARQPG